MIRKKSIFISTLVTKQFETLRLHVLITSSGSLPGPAPKLMTLLEGMTDELLSCQLHKQTACRPASDSRLGGEEARSSDNDMGDRGLSGHLIYKSYRTAF